MESVTKILSYKGASNERGSKRVEFGSRYYYFKSYINGNLGHLKHKYCGVFYHSYLFLDSRDIFRNDSGPVPGRGCLVSIIICSLSSDLQRLIITTFGCQLRKTTRAVGGIAG